MTEAELEVYLTDLKRGLAEARFYATDSRLPEKTRNLWAEHADKLTRWISEEIHNV